MILIFKIYNNLNKQIYVIRNDYIYDLSGTNVGSINGNIFTIDEVDYEYKIDLTKKQKLYGLSAGFL